MATRDHWEDEYRNVLDSLARHVEEQIELGIEQSSAPERVSKPTRARAPDASPSAPDADDSLSAADGPTLGPTVRPTGGPTQGVLSMPEKPGPFEALNFDELSSEASGCTRCPLHATRTTVVFGVGDRDADLMFIGEAPGHDEDKQGEPFVGRAGQLLTRIIEAMGLTRDRVYICNVIKCRPPENRNPVAEEVEKCRGFLRRQVELVRPKVIVGLGNVAVQYLLDTPGRISRLRGQFHDFGDAKLMPTYHPAFLLRNPNAKREVWEDMQLVMAELGLTLPAE